MVQEIRAMILYDPIRLAIQDRFEEFEKRLNADLRLLTPQDLVSDETRAFIVSNRLMEKSSAVAIEQVQTIHELLWYLHEISMNAFLGNTASESFDLVGVTDQGATIKITNLSDRPILENRRLTNKPLRAF
jgi:hypothetical protein